MYKFGRKRLFTFQLFCRKYKILYSSKVLGNGVAPPTSSFVRLPLLISCLPPGTQHQPAVWSGPSWITRSAHALASPSTDTVHPGWDLQQAHQPDRRLFASQDSSPTWAKPVAVPRWTCPWAKWDGTPSAAHRPACPCRFQGCLPSSNTSCHPSNAFAANQTHQGSYNTFRLHSPCALYGYNFSTSPKLAASPEKIVSSQGSLGSSPSGNHDGSADAASRGRSAPA